MGLGWGGSYTQAQAKPQAAAGGGMIQNAVGKGYSKPMENARRVLIDPLNIFPGMSSGPQKQSLGGSPEALDAMRGEYAANNAVGQGIQSQGVGDLGLGAKRAGGVYDKAVGAGADMGQQMFAQGGGTMSAGLSRQNKAANKAHDIAASENPAQIAQAQANAALASSQRNTLAQGRAGGLMGLRSAMAENDAAGANVAMQSGAMAAQLEQQRKQDMLVAEGLAANVGSQQSSLGAGLQTQGAGTYGSMLGIGNQSAGVTANAGGQLGQLGLGTQQTYTGAALDANKTQLDQDWKQAQADKQAKSGFISNIAKSVGSFF
jgi:hypothetical protein